MVLGSFFWIQCIFQCTVLYHQNFEIMFENFSPKYFRRNSSDEICYCYCVWLEDASLPARVRCISLREESLLVYISVPILAWSWKSGV